MNLDYSNKNLQMCEKWIVHNLDNDPVLCIIVFMTVFMSIDSSYNIY